MAPRDARAAEGIDHHDRYGGPPAGLRRAGLFLRPGRRLGPDGEGEATGPTLAMLQDAAGDKGVVLRFRKDQLPAFTLWKNTGGLRDGYVTGLEPGTNYPTSALSRVPTGGSSPCRPAAITSPRRPSRSSPPARSHGGRVRDPAHPGPAPADDPSAAHRAIHARLTRHPSRGGHGDGDHHPRDL